MVESLYHLKKEDVLNLTLLEFYIKQKNLLFVAKLYNPMIGEAKEHKEIKNQKACRAILDMIKNNRSKK